MKRHEPPQVGRVLVGEAPYVTGEVHSLAELPDDLIQELGSFFANSSIEFEAKCPRCDVYMDMWNVPYDKPMENIVKRTGYKYTSTHHDIFCCPECGYMRDRNID